MTRGHVFLLLLGLRCAPAAWLACGAGGAPSSLRCRPGVSPPRRFGGVLLVDDTVPPTPTAEAEQPPSDELAVEAAEVRVQQAEAALSSLDPEAEAAEAAAAPPAEEEPQLPAWFEDVDESALAVGTAEAAAPLAAPEEPPAQMLTLEDLVNTKWTVRATPREDSWLNGDVREQEFTLLSDFTVVWGGTAGGFGTGGRWTLKDGILEVIRTTPLMLVTGRDYYMMQARVEVDDKLQFRLGGIIRSYNALQPVMVIADFEANRLPGRFVRDTDDDDES